jgi:aminoglycoside phosphotransferase family enzyme
LQQEIRADARPNLAAKVAFLSSPGAYPDLAQEVVRRETHMSWVFLAGDKVYKLKKPVTFSYLDFSTLRHREAACRAELRLNRRLAPDVYEDVVALTQSARGLSIGGAGDVVDWLVVMRRLDERATLERAILEDRLEPWQLDRLAAALVAFYRRTNAVFVSVARHLADWHRSVALNRRILLDARLALPCGLVTQIDRAQRLFLAERADLLAERVRGRHIVDGHGDLRPEHIWLGDPVRIIDCLEFNARLRSVDPFDEVAFLCIECERLGAPWAGEYLRRRVGHALRGGLGDALFSFYRCHRATLRARLAIAHLLEPEPRTPEKWPRLARTYLELAAADAIRIRQSIKTPACR